MTTRPPSPAFVRETALQKVRLAEDGWNSRDPVKVAQAYSLDSLWRNRAEFIEGREAIVAFLARKWAKEARLPAYQGTLGVWREPHRCPLCLRVARRFAQLVSLVRK